MLRIRPPRPSPRAFSHFGPRRVGALQSLEQVLLGTYAPPSGRDCAEAPSYITAITKPPDRPTRHFCLVTGCVAKYKDPQSGLRFASVKAFRTLKEQPPPWVHSSGIASFRDALRYLQGTGIKTNVDDKPGSVPEPTNPNPAVVGGIKSGRDEVPSRKTKRRPGRPKRS